MIEWNAVLRQSALLDNRAPRVPQSFARPMTGLFRNRRNPAAPGCRGADPQRRHRHPGRLQRRRNRLRARPGQRHHRGLLGRIARTGIAKPCDGDPGRPTPRRQRRKLGTRRPLQRRGPGGESDRNGCARWQSGRYHGNRRHHGRRGRGRRLGDTGQAWRRRRPIGNDRDWRIRHHRRGQRCRCHLADGRPSWCRGWRRRGWRRRGRGTGVEGRAHRRAGGGQGGSRWRCGDRQRRQSRASRIGRVRPIRHQPAGNPPTHRRVVNRRPRRHRRQARIRRIGPWRLRPRLGDPPALHLMPPRDRIAPAGGASGEHQQPGRQRHGGTAHLTPPDLNPPDLNITGRACNTPRTCASHRFGTAPAMCHTNMMWRR